MGLVGRKKHTIKNGNSNPQLNFTFRNGCSLNSVNRKKIIFIHNLCFGTSRVLIRFFFTKFTK